jgi:hypothetical protein
MPTVLASVYRYWRNIVLSTSTNLKLDQMAAHVGEEHMHTTFLDVQRLAAHIARSRSPPVDIPSILEIQIGISKIASKVLSSQ